MMTETMPRYHHGDLRAAVLRRAEEVLRESGTDALSLRGIARDLGVSHAAPSAHFRDKNALFAALAAGACAAPVLLGFGLPVLVLLQMTLARSDPLLGGLFLEPLAKRPCSW